MNPFGFGNSAAIQRIAGVGADLRSSSVGLHLTQGLPPAHALG